MDRRKFLQFSGITFGLSIAESCSNAKSQTTKLNNMSETNLQQSPENLKTIEQFAGRSQKELDEFLQKYKGEIYIATIDRRNRYIQNSLGYLPSPKKIGESGNNTIIQLPEKNIIIVGIIKELNYPTEVAILNSLQRHSVFSTIDTSGNYQRDNRNWDHPKIVEVPNSVRAVKAETYHSTLIPVKELRNQYAEYYTHNPTNGGLVTNKVPEKNTVVQSFQGANIKEGLLVQGGEGVTSELRF